MTYKREWNSQDYGGFKHVSEFNHGDEVIIFIDNKKQYGWISTVNFPRKGADIYDVYTIVGWEGREFDSKPIINIELGINPRDIKVKMSDKFLPESIKHFYKHF